MRKLSPVTTH